MDAAHEPILTVQLFRDFTKILFSESNMFLLEAGKGEYAFIAEFRRVHSFIDISSPDVMVPFGEVLENYVKLYFPGIKPVLLTEELFDEIALLQDDVDIVRMKKDDDFKSDDFGKLTFVDLFKFLDFISQADLSAWRMGFYRCTDDEQQMMQCLRLYLETMDVTDLTIPTTRVVTNVLMQRASDEFPSKIQKRDVFFGQVQFLFRKDILKDETVLTLRLVEGDDLSESYILQALEECSTLYGTFMMMLKKLRSDVPAILVSYYNTNGPFFASVGFTYCQNNLFHMSFGPRDFSVTIVFIDGEEDIDRKLVDPAAFYNKEGHKVKLPEDFCTTTTVSTFCHPTTTFAQLETFCKAYICEHFSVMSLHPVVSDMLRDCTSPAYIRAHASKNCFHSDKLCEVLFGEVHGFVCFALSVYN